MTGKNIRNDKYCKVEFGAYVQVHEKLNNKMEPGRSGAIALRPSGNEQDGHNCLILHTLEKNNNNNWTESPMQFM